MKYVAPTFYMTCNVCVHVHVYQPHDSGVKIGSKIITCEKHLVHRENTGRSDKIIIKILKSRVMHERNELLYESFRNNIGFQ